MIRFLYSLFDNCRKKSTDGPVVRRGLGLAIVLSWLVFASGSIATGQWIETFDRPGEYFRLWRDDCRAVLQRPARSEPGVETLELSFGHGTYVHLLFPIEPCAVVDDLTASIRLRCVHDGLRLALRVVYPNSSHLATSDPLYTLVFGTPAEGNGRWSTSIVRNIRREVETHQRLLRAKHGPDVDFSQPYVDAVVVVAGMEGALPSVVGGWVDCPVVAVPTSVGYGASFGGLAALLGMLNSCASNVTVVNIDAGFKAAYVAGLIAHNRRRPR